MSHIVYAWYAKTLGKAPANLDQISKDFAYLSLHRTGQTSTSLVSFAQALASHVPTDNLQEWQDLYMNLDKSILEKGLLFIALDLPNEDWIVGLKTVVDIAEQHSIIIFDDALGMAFLPSGKILPQSKQKMWKNALLEVETTDFPITLSSFKKIAQPLVEGLLFKYGFTEKYIDIENEDDIWRFYSTLDNRYKFGIAYETQFQPDRQSDVFQMTHETCCYYGSEISSIYNKFDFFKNGECISINFGISKTQKNIDITNEDSLRTGLFQIENLLKLTLSIKDIKSLDNIMNGNLYPQLSHYYHHFFYMPHCLIVARLANNPKFEQLAIDLGTYGSQSGRNWGAHVPKQITEWPKLVQYLREEINPDTFEQQYALVKKEEQHLEENRIQYLIETFNLNPAEELIPVSDQWHIPETNLIWQRCCMGQHWENGEPVGEKKAFKTNDVQLLLEKMKDSGWRLPTYHELLGLSFIKKTGHVTKQGFDFYEQREQEFLMHWIQPHNLNYPDIKEDVHVLSVRNGKFVGIKLENQTNLVGYVRLVKSIS